ncbi:MAG: hypothetical protein L3V56_12350 [Candidatus Magnetoovum sp. WYHC-5]|nr:hypothetical protein [Candidatus Magnetoovum sp. WYHC-5]
METKTIYEEDILKEIQGLPDELQRKVMDMVHSFKDEILFVEVNEKILTEDFLSVCGTWEDSRSVEEQIRDIELFRKSAFNKDDIL